MESPTDIKAALTTRARTATLDELRNEGKRRVRVVKADQITQMIEESVHRAVEQSGLLPATEVEKLVERSRQEFRALMKAREAEAERAQAMSDLLANQEREVADLRRQLAAAKAAQLAAEQALAEAQSAQAAAAPAAAAVEEATARAAAQAQADLLASLRDEMAGMKAALLAQPPAAVAAPAIVAAPGAVVSPGAVASPTVGGVAAAAQAMPAAAAAQAAPAVDVSAAIEKLASSLNDRFEKLGKKMGISSAVGGDQPVDLGGLFKSADAGLESNINTVETKQKSGGGIAANLARLKKLKGGG